MLTATLAGTGLDTSTITRTYDNAGRMTSEAQTLGSSTHTVTYGHDGADRLTGIAYPSGPIVEYGHNLRGELLTVSLDGPPPLATYQRRGPRIFSR
jgi:YD repeat-containing protein